MISDKCFTIITLIPYLWCYDIAVLYKFKLLLLSLSLHPTTELGKVQIPLRRLSPKLPRGERRGSFGESCGHTLQQSPWQVCNKPVCAAVMEFSPLQCTGKVSNKVRGPCHVESPRHKSWKLAWWNLGFIVLYDMLNNSCCFLSQVFITCYAVVMMCIWQSWFVYNATWENRGIEQVGIINFLRDSAFHSYF